MTAQQKALGGAVVALLCIFAAIAVSVVQSRQSFEAELTRSVQAEVSDLSGSAATTRCQKDAVDFYDCVSVVRPRAGLASVQLRQKIWLTDDGCWTVFRVRSPAPPAALGPLRTRVPLIRGCIASSRQ